MKEINNKAFTLVELLVVVAIVGILITVVVISITGAQVRARDAKRISDIKGIDSALRIYFQEEEKYPVKPGCSGKYTSNTDNGYVSSTCGPATDWIPDLVPKYIPFLPSDPGPTYIIDTFGPWGSPSTKNARGYMYRSNGTDYKIMAHWPENRTDARFKTSYDPNRDGNHNGSKNTDGSNYTGTFCNNNVVDCNDPWAWAFYSDGAKSW